MVFGASQPFEQGEYLRNCGDSPAGLVLGRMSEFLTLEPHAELPEAALGAIVAFEAGANGSLYAVAALSPLDNRVIHGGGASLPGIRPEEPQNYAIHRVENGSATLVTTILNEAFNIHHLQPLGNDRLLLLSSRCEYRPNDRSDENGRIYRTDGSFIRGITLGDGIQNVSVTPGGLIWTSYFDEGVFGNFGWEKPLGISGLVAWREDGTKACEFKPSGKLGRISDCYAMNTSGSEVWVYYYPDFPLVRITDKRVREHWVIPVDGADAFAVEGSHVLFHGSYDDRHVLHLLALEPRTATARCLARFELRDGTGERIEAQRVASKDDTLFLLRGREIFKVNVAEVRARFGN